MNKAKKVLIVEDDIDYQLQLKLQLEALNFEVITADGTSGAIEAFELEKPDIAIVDLMLEHPDSGFTLSYKFKKQAPTIPIILISCVTRLTGIDFDASTDEGRSWIKANTMLNKPFRFEQLRKEIDRLLRAPVPA
jgi:two-component system, OmpR family, response regulator